MLSINDLSMRFGSQILFEGVTCQFNTGRYGLVGANGSGKSTFIKILTGELLPESGNIHKATQSSIGSLKQNHYMYEEEEILQIVLRGRKQLWDALETKKQLLQQEKFSETESEKLAYLEKVIAEEEGYTASSEAAKLLEGLGIQEEWHARPLRLLSGGYKLRVLLAQVFFSRPSILILDEPTNHLDLYSIKWLEGYLKQFPGTLIVSSHDRDFLNTICTHIADVDYGSIRIYKGGYNEFHAFKQQEREQKIALLEKYGKRRDDIQQFIDRFGAKATKARQAQSKARLVEQLEDQMEGIDLTPSSRLYPDLNFNALRSSGQTALKVKDIAKAYGTKQVLSQVSFEVERGDRIAIIGPNGIGKSTLLEILTGHLPSDQGSFEWGFAARIAYFPQDHAREVEGAVSLLDWLSNVDRTLHQEQVRDMLGRVLFSGDKVHQPIHTLSGGETARLILAKMMLQKPNILIFDEPTNHLDMEAIEELSDALKTFEGTILLVSHNRYFVSQLATRILDITPKGIQDFKGSYLEYLERQQAVDYLAQPTSLKQRYGAEIKDESREKISSYEEQKKWRSIKAQLKKRITQAEEECEKIEKQLKELEETMASEVFYQTTPRDKQQQVLNQKKQLEEQLIEAMAKWEQASLEYQTAENQESV